MTDDTTPDESRTERLCALVCDDVKSRQQWLNRQTTWYVMRHDGLRRKNKPWPHAADLHYPLVDTTIEKFKPFYFNQLFATETLAQFIPKVPEFAPLAQNVGYWFDWKLKQQSNLEKETLIGIDKMLMAGHVPFKIGWDTKENRVYFDAIEPSHCIVPDQTEDIQKADRVTLIHHLSPEQYRRDDRWQNKDEEFIKSITGRGSRETGGDEQLRQAKELREGITHVDKESNIIIIWETWEQTPEGWFVDFYSPLKPKKGVRAPQKNPFDHGKCPVVRIDVELKEKSHYASRGVPEKQATYENYLCKVWNEKSDAMTLFNRPVYSAQAPIPNAGNLKLTPGQIVPFPIQAIGNPRPPISFDEEINSTRGISEANIGVPDYGIGAEADKNQPRTATEVKAIGTQGGVGVDLRARTFRIGLAQILQLAWQTLVQYDKDTQFYIGSELKKLPPDVLKGDAWMVMPNGSSESWNKPQQLQKAIVRKQLFENSPWINQPELDKSILELDDPRLVARLFMDPNQAQRNEYEDEAQILPTLMLGMPIQGDIGQDQVTRIKCLMDFMRAAPHLGHPPTPPAISAIDARIKAHLAVLAQKDPKTAKLIAKQIDSEAQAHAGNVVPMSGAPAPAAEPAMGQ